MPESEPAPRTPTERLEPPKTLVAFGLVLPAFALFVELGTRVCASNFFDPLPTAWHVALFAFVPLGSLWLIVRWPAGSSASDGGTTPAVARRSLVALNGVLVGISAYFAIMFLPLLPVAVLGTLFVLGAGGWAPLLALHATVRAQARLVDRLGGRRAAAWGIALGLLLCAVVEGGQLAARVGLGWIDSDDPAIQRRGLWVLRTFADREALRRACFGERVEEGLLGCYARFGRRFQPVRERMPALYYRVTGRVHTDGPRPRRTRGDLALGTRGDDGAWDASQGTERTGAVLSDLGLVESALDAVVEPEAALAYLEWTFTFENTSLSWAREARAQLELPPGGVVARLTAWIGGVECEAAFAERERTSAAYFSVVPGVPQREGIDPVLVVTGGPDRVRLQCYPVLPGGRMKVRLGITAPLLPVDDETLVLARPRLGARNFERRDAPHVHVAGAPAEDGEHVLCRVPLAAVREAEVRDERVGGRIVQTLTEHAYEPVERLVLVVDGSASMREVLEPLAALVESLAGPAAFDLVVAGDEVVVACRGERSAAEVARAIRAVIPRGGTDGLPALLRARDLARESGERALCLWVHGPQPFAFADLERDAEPERRGFGRELHELQVAPGRNVLVEWLEERVSAVPRAGPWERDLARFLERRVRGAPFPRLVRTVEDAPAPAGRPPTAAEGHVLRVWGRERVEAFLRTNAPERAAEALDLARRLQLVTPISGAVVLESEAQYRLHGLEPVDRATVPSVPEPGFWILCGVVVLGFAYARWRGFVG